MPFSQGITSVEQLRSLYREPFEAVFRKQIDHIDDAARSFIERSPFLVLATSGPRGNDASPRGGPPGFVAVIDERRLALGDLSGNNRLDSYANIVEHPHVGMLFFIPGMDETLRVNGRATLTTDPEVLEKSAIDGRVPRIALGIDVDECFLHCAKALRRGGLWDPSSWPAREERPSPGAIFKAHVGIDAPAEAIEADLEEGYKVSMWYPGGREDLDTATD